MSDRRFVRARWLVLCVLALVLAAALPASALAQTAPTTTKPPAPFSEKVSGGDCRSLPSPCINLPRTGRATISPHLVREGEKVTLSFALIDGGVSFTMPKGLSGCTSETGIRPREVRNSAGKLEVKDTEVETGSTCTFTPGPTNGRWATMSVNVVGPCGSLKAVEEGYAEFADCGRTYASDYYGVIAKDDDRYGISGQARFADGSPMVGIAITASGPESKSTKTGPSGDYAFLVKKGTYTVSAGAKACVVPRGKDKCSPSKSVTVPDSQTVDFEAEAEGVIEGTVRDRQARPMSNVTVAVEGTGGATVKTDGKGRYRAVVSEGDFVVSATREVNEQSTDASGNPTTTTRTQRFCTSSRETADVACTTSLRVDVPPDRTIDFTPEDDPGLLVDLQAQDVGSAQFFAVRMVLTNPRSQPVVALKFDTPNGLEVEPGEPQSKEPVVQMDGPDRAMPITLDAGESEVRNYRFLAVDPGHAYISVGVSGSQGDGTKVAGAQEATLTVEERQVEQRDLDNILIDAIERKFALTAQARTELNALIASGAGGVLGDDASPGEIAAARQLAIPKDLSGLVKLKRDEFNAFWLKYGEIVGEGFLESRDGVRELLQTIQAVADDPVARRMAAETIIQGLRDLGSNVKKSELGGFLADTFGLNGLDGVKQAVEARDEAISDLQRGLNETLSGQREINAQRKARRDVDPVGAAADDSKMLADGELALGNELVATVVGDGSVAVVTNAIRGLRLARTAAAARRLESTEAAIAAAGGDGASTTFARLERGLLESAQELPYGAPVARADLPTVGGMDVADGAYLDSVLTEAEERFGVPFEGYVRTGEPLSAGKGLLAKEEWNKYKATGLADRLLGAADGAEGKVAIHKNLVEPDAKTLDALDYRVPGTAADVKARLRKQQGNLADWKNPQSKMRTIVDGAKNYPEGITIIEPRPKNDIPVVGLYYLEQLDEPAFLASKNLSAEQAAQLKTTLANHPGRYPKSKPQATDRGDYIEFSDGLRNNKVYGSDNDIQAFRPVDGRSLPPGVSQGDVDKFFLSKLGGTGRFPMHGWSEAAVDLPVVDFELAAGYSINTAHPAYAREKAEDFAARFKKLAAELRTKAADETLEPAKREVLAKKAAAFDALADADVLLEKYPPGEKVLKFTRGRIEVAAGPR